MKPLHPPPDLDTQQRAIELLQRELRAAKTTMSRRDIIRLFLAASSGVLLSGCDVTERDSTQAGLQRISRFNDTAQAALLDPRQRAIEYPSTALTKPFRFNAFYSQASVPEIDIAKWRLKVEGRVTPHEQGREWTLAQLMALPAITERTRLICIEGWSAVGEWTGVPLRYFLQLIGADTNAKYVAFKCADGYYTSIDMASAMHAQTMLAFAFGGQHRLPDEFGFPLRLRIPVKLGFKNPKHLTHLMVTNEFTSGYWEDLHGYNWFAGL